ncbi:MAG: hypothetical protein MPW15_11460 [Candidatus Manganitrophus sp.]|nr:hypothetical protein [Candidatus Manganitrophus sp.]
MTIPVGDALAAVRPIQGCGCGFVLIESHIHFLLQISENWMTTLMSSGFLSKT